MPENDETAHLRSALRAAITALKPFADCVYNDNGDCTVSDTFSVTPDEFITAHFAEKKCRAALSQ
jgi:hypothetical protein